MDSILNWVGQGLVVALAVAALRAVARTAPARARYVTATVGLIAVVVLPLAALLPEWTHDIAGSAAAAGHASALVALPSQWWTSGWLVFALWSVWSVVALVRIVGGLRALGRARRSSQPFPAGIEERLPNWQAIRATGRRTRLVLSDAVRTAAVLGGRTPLIAVSPAIVDALRLDDLDRIVVHEWAHVQWRDDRAQALQAWIGVIAGWHPAVWWLDRQLHFEREVACDEHAVRLTGSPKAYARCLATLASLPANTARALPAVGASAGSHLRCRVTRVLRCGATTTRQARLAAGCACVMPVAFASLVADVRMVASPPPAFMASMGIAPARVPRVQDAGDHATQLPTLPAAITARTRRDVPVRRTRAPQREPVTAAIDLAGEDPPAEDAFAASFGAERPEPMPARASPPLAIDARWPLTSLRDSATVFPATPGDERVSLPETSTLWSAAATGGAAIGRGSQRAAASTAGFFARVGKTIAGSF